jgi:hypothetical protein
MRIAIDIDNTITANPAFFRRFIEDQMRAGNEVHILTGGVSIPEGNVESPPHRVRQLKSYGIESYTRLVQVTRRSQHPDIGEGKGEYCRDNRIDMVLEDDVLYVQEISRISPDTQAFLIVPR